MTNQVILYDRMANVVKLIDGIKSIPLTKAQKMGFTPAYLMQVACDLLSLDKDTDPQAKTALDYVKAALKECPATKWDRVGYILSYDRMSDKVKIFGGAITVPFNIAVHKGVTPAHMVEMATQLLSLKHQSALKSANRALEACKLAQQGLDKYKSKRYR